MQPLLPPGHAALQVGQVQGLDIPLVLAGLLIQTDVLKLEDHGQLRAVRGAVQLRPLYIRAPGFAHYYQALLQKCFLGHLPQVLVQAGAVAGDMEFRVFPDLIHHIQPEALYALIHPEAHDIIDLLAHLGILPVQIRLLRGKLMEIVLPQFGNIGPGWAAKGGQHIIGFAGTVAVSPDVIVMVGVIPTLQRLPEPEVLVGAVVGHHIQDDGNPPFLCLPDQGFHVLHSANAGVNIPVIGDIVAVIHLGRPAHG